MSNQLLRFASGWTPAALGSNLRLWLRSDSNITLNGSNVSAWGDKTANANNFTQATAADQPVYFTDSTLGNKQVVQFNNADNVSIAASPVSLQPLLGGWSVFFLTKLTTGGNASSGDYPNIIGARPWLAAADKGWNISQKIAGAGSNTIGVHFADGVSGIDVTSAGSTTALSNSTYQFWIITINRSTDTITYYLNGVVDATRAFIDPANTIDQTSPMVISRDSSAGNRRYGGYIPEIGCVAGVLSAGEIASFNQYIKGRYGL